MQDLRKKLEGDGDVIDQLEEAKKKLQRDLEDRSQQLEEKTAQADKVTLYYSFAEIFLKMQTRITTEDYMHLRHYSQ